MATRKYSYLARVKLPPTKLGFASYGGPWTRVSVRTDTGDSWHRTFVASNDECRKVRPRDEGDPDDAATACVPHRTRVRLIAHGHAIFE